MWFLVHRCMFLDSDLSFRSLFFRLLACDSFPAWELGWVLVLLLEWVSVEGLLLVVVLEELLELALVWVLVKTLGLEWVLGVG